jgi:hypothetical protein
MIICVVIAFNLLLSTASATEFSADIVETVDGKITTNNFYFRDGKYRIDGEEDGQKFIALVDIAGGTTTVIAPSEKYYLQMESSEFRGLVNNPFASLEMMKENGESKSLGTETIDGYDCEKTKISMQGQDIMTYWNSTKLQFPIKIVSHYGGAMSVELKNIREGEGNVDMALFAIPDGFAKFSHPDEIPQPIPDWAGDIKSAVVLKPPFTKEMKTGDIIRVKPEPGYSLWLRAETPEGVEADVRCIAFKNGRPIKELWKYNNFATKGTICSRHHETTLETDEFIIRVSKETTVVEAKLSPMNEKTLKAGEEFRMPLNQSHNINVRFVNLSDDETVLKNDYFKEGKSSNEGQEKYRIHTLKRPGEVYKMTWSVKGDELLIKVEKGEALIKLGQFDSFKF